MKTNYTIVQDEERLNVLDKGKIFTRGFLTESDALHSIWVMNGNVPNHFYNVDDGIVSCEVENLV